MTRYASKVVFLRSHLASETPWSWPMENTYRWDSAMVHQLLSSLQSDFNRHYQPSHGSSAVSRYGESCLGTVHVIQSDQKAVLIDGFQRLTTLLLLLIAVAQCVKHRDVRLYQRLTDWQCCSCYAASNMAFDTAHYGSLLQAVVNGSASCIHGWSSLGINIKDRYRDIQSHPLLTEICDEGSLPMFTDWLLSHVVWIEVTAFGPADADFSCFESLNRRGTALDRNELHSSRARQSMMLPNATPREMGSADDTTD